MKEMSEKLIGQDCIIYFNIDKVSTVLKTSGILTYISDTALCIEHEDKTIDIFPISVIKRIRQHPVDKKGKKINISFIID